MSRSEQATRHWPHEVHTPINAKNLNHKCLEVVDIYISATLFLRQTFKVLVSIKFNKTTLKLYFKKCLCIEISINIACNN